MYTHPSVRVAASAALLMCSQASAQTTEQLPGFDLERLDTNVGRGTLLVGNGELMAPGGLSVNLLGHYQNLPLVLNDGEQLLSVVRHRATGLLSASYGVLPWLEVGAQVPFVVWQEGDDPQLVGLSLLTAQGLGTPVLQARLGLLSQRQRQPVDLSADLGVGLPVGTSSALAGDLGPRFHARMTVGANLGSWLRPSLEAGVLFRPSILLDTAESESKPGALSEVRLGAALATRGQGLRGELGLRATLTPATSQVSMEVLGGVRFPLLIGLDAFVLGGPGVGNALGTPRFRVLAGVTFSHEPPPRISFLDQNADRELQLTLSAPKPPPEEEAVRSAGTWEFGSLSRGDPQDSSTGPARREPLQPYQPGPQERLMLRGEIHFEPGSTELPGVVPLLDQAAQRLLEQTKGATILVEGHADSEGSDTSNMILALQRAQAVRRYLIDQGLPGSQVKIRSLGSNWPVSAKPATEAERRLNRRAEVLVLSEETPVTTQAPSP